jgi:hypothetical protein
MKELMQHLVHGRCRGEAQERPAVALVVLNCWHAVPC